MCWCVCMSVLVIVLTERCNLFMFDWKLVFENIMYVAVTVASIQGNSIFTVAEGESRISTVEVDEILIFNKNNFKSYVGY